MKTAASLFGLALILVSIHVSAGVFTPIPTRTGNYCKDEVLEFFENRFPEAKVLSLKTFGNGRDWAFWMRTDICGGYFVFDFRGLEGFQCKMQQYWHRARFMNRVWAYGDCREIMPHDEYAL